MEKVWQLCLDSGLDFAAYRPPDKEITTVIQYRKEPLTPAREITKGPGFLISPYRTGSCKAILISPDMVITGDKTDKELLLRLSHCGKKEKIRPCGKTATSSFEQYIGQAQKAIAAIKGGDFEKIVLSRVQMVKGSKRDLSAAIFLRMCRKYPRSFVYIFQAKGHLWLGATPETLVSIKDGSFKTMSLAATRKDIPANWEINNWSTKERQEQRYVTDYIADLLDKYQITSAQKSRTYPRRAGNLLHLCNEFTCDAGEIYNKLSQFINELHPSPAVCGIPKKKVQEFLAELEGHDREYYAGFLGPVNIAANQIDLYVNLRCMRVCDDQVRLYIGGGLTADSIPEDEWAETAAKAETLLSVLSECQ